MDKYKLLFIVICTIIGAQVGYIILLEVTGKGLVFTLLSITGLIFASIVVLINMKKKANKH